MKLKIEIILENLNNITRKNMINFYFSLSSNEVEVTDLLVYTFSYF